MRVKQNKTSASRHRSGMALMLVIPGVAVATVLAYAVLANTGTQEQITANSATLAQIDCLAESGVNYAIYSLQNPSRAPVHVGTFWPGTGGNAITLDGSPGTVQIVVQDYGAGQYKVTSTATAAATSNISRTMGASIQLTIPVGQPNQAAGFNGNLVLGPLTALTVPVGNILSNGSVTLNGLSSILGLVMQNASTAPAPTTTTNYQTYMINGMNYSAQLIATAPAAGTVLGATTTNPAGIYYTVLSTMNLNGVTINGTLYAPNTAITVTGSSANTITPSANFPGLIAKSVVVSGTNKALIVNGVLWANAAITGGGTGSSITVNGSLMIPRAQAIASGYSGTITLNYTPKNINVPNFSTTAQTPTSAKVTLWSTGSN